MTKATSSRKARIRLAPVVALVTAGALSGCGLLDVENPNNLVDTDLEQPAAGNSLSNGALANVARGVGEYVACAAMASDETTWIGSRDAWGELDRGNVDNPSNEFTDDAFKWLSEGRWMSDLAIETLSAQQSEGTILDEADLGRAYLWGGIVYTYIADWLDDYAFSDKAESSPPVGEDNMDQVYMTAIDYLTQANQILTAEGEDFNAAWALAQRARAKHGLGVWQKLNPPGSVPSDPLVGSAAGAKADALLALAAVDASIELPVNTVFEFDYGPGTYDHDMGFQVNSRLEHRFGNRYIVPTADDKRRESTRIMDPIDNVIDPQADAILQEFEAGGTRIEDAPLKVTSVREMLLIIAEADLADGDIDGFTAAINGLRSLSDKSPYDPATHDAILEQMEFGFDGPTNLLIHERLANLVMTGRILNDHYRFGFASDFWLPQSVAVNVPGTIMPISIGERQANTCIVDPGSC